MIDHVGENQLSMTNCLRGIVILRHLQYDLDLSHLERCIIVPRLIMLVGTLKSTHYDQQFPRYHDFSVFALWLCPLILNVKETFCS